MYREELQRLGFSPKEATVFLTLLRLGPSAASTLARTTGIKRTSIYDVLNSLMERSLVHSFKQGRHTYFVVDDVNELYLQEKQKTQLAKELVEKFQNEMNMPQGVQVHYYKGHEGYREIYEEILRAKPEEIMVWIHLDNFWKGLDMEREDQWTKERIQKKIYARLIMQDTKVGRAFQKEDHASHRETRLISEYPSETTCFLYDGHILMFDTTDETRAIRIKNPQLYQMFTQIFQMNWVALGKSQ
jgi:sugar-specific transcriptional regulator TrmB